MNPGIYNLGDRAVTGPLTDEVITSGVSDSGVAQEFLGNFGGMLAATIVASFNYASGGTTAKVDIETSLDQGVNWIPVARLAFTTASADKVINLSGLTPKTTPYAPVTLADDAVVDGILGDRWRVRVTSTGTYGGSTTVSVRLHAR